jgi:secondary thiamine-phosphate synthase enzyme
MFETKELYIKAKADCGIVNITEEVSNFAGKSKIKNGIICVFCVGSTGAITVMEYEPGLEKDLPKLLDKLIPLDKDYKHHKTWGDYNGGSHLRATLIGPSLTIPLIEGKLSLGTWQQIIYLNFDRMEKTRTIIVQILGD